MADVQVWLSYTPLTAYTKSSYDVMADDDSHESAGSLSQNITGHHGGGECQYR